MERQKAKSKSRREEIRGSRADKAKLGRKAYGGVNYPVGDFLIRLKNALLAKHKSIEAQSTKYIAAVVQTLAREGYLEEVRQHKNLISARLVYRHKEPVLSKIRLISRPGLRVYATADEIEQKKGPSIYILSTPYGVITSKEAIKKRVGGEVIAEIL